MNRVQRALGSVSMDQYARSLGERSAAQMEDILRLHHTLDSGGSVKYADAERLRQAHYPAIPHDFFHGRIVAYVNEGRSARERADRLTDCVRGPVNLQTGTPLRASTERDAARELSRGMATQEVANSVVEKLDERDAHRDKNSGIDNRARIEQAKHAAMQNPDAQRRTDIERAFTRHEGPQPALYAADRREMLAQGHDRIGERIVQRQVRDSDPNRRPDRGDDRRDDVRLQIDRLSLEQMSGDELALNSNPLLEAVDDLATHNEAASAVTE